ncbi:MAG: 3-phosphoshikimate 1-carboxyvinyltransferase [Gammaproteobacteria bacterium]|nr:3-phosphoshikimate 1-carboxyvinyltransferase [Gammaproteobacteria bacterium]MBV9723681.1 3-phosphoshikimate 1-carboxyvinyltransferase [Gammaproteobacteria bacterium]
MSLAPPRAWRVAPGGTVSGTFTVPGDKSISHRALMLGALAEGETHISGFLAGEDCLATARALEALGVRIERPAATDVRVHGRGRRGLAPSAAPLDLGNAGTAMRLMMGVLAPQDFDATLIGDASLMRRPMERVAEPLRRMGAHIDTQAGRPPVVIHGTPQLHGITYTLPVASAQVKSALLLAGLSARGATQLTEPAPSRDHTERMLRAFGIRVHQEARVITLEGGEDLRAAKVGVPADFSSAAFFLVAAALAAERPLTLTNVGINPTRTGLLELLKLMGADIRIHPRPGTTRRDLEPIADIEVSRAPLQGITVPEALVPLAIDELPVFFVAAAAAQGETLVRGAGELRVKESDRLAAVASGLAVLGVEHELLPDGLRIQGRREFCGGVIDSMGDHRIAMAFAIAALRARAPIEITDVANVATSFPGFEDCARQAGLGLATL